LTEASVERVVFCKPAQIGGTEIGISAIGYFSHQEPCPIMLILADEDTAKYMSRERIQPMFRESAELRSLPDKTLWTVEEMRFLNGAYIAIGWASSVAKLASRPIRLVICDETDKPGYLLTTKEGSPISLAVQRSETFYNRKILLLSTPTLVNGNIITELMAADEIRDFHVPCPHCGAFQPLRWSIEYAHGFDDGLFRAEDGTMKKIGGVVWEGGRNADEEQIAAAVYKCGPCGGAWATVEKNVAVQAGKWVARSEPVANPRSVGFHVNRLYSLLGKSGDIPKLVADFLDARSKGPGEMQTFVNSALSEPWILTIAKTTESAILKARADYDQQTVPADVVALSCGVDMQKRGFWFVVRGFTRNYRSYLIHYGWLGSYDELETLLFKTRYPVVQFGDAKPIIADMGIWRAGIDTGGGKLDLDIDLTMTEQLYFWIRQNAGRPGPLIWPTKGSSHPMDRIVKVGQPIDKTPSGKPLPGGLSIATLDTGALKDAVFFRIGQAVAGEDIQPAFLHKQTGADYARQITAEEKRLNEKRVKEWVRIRPDNHLLDAECIALAIMEPEMSVGGLNTIFRPPTPRPRRKEPVATEQERRGSFKRGTIDRMLSKIRR
jgi:phage terminase large subunit GpA-like protein